MRYSTVLDVTTYLGEEQIALSRRSNGVHPFVAWHGLGGVNGFWRWDIFWNRGRTELVGLPGHGPVRRYPFSHYLRWTPQHFIEVGIGALARLNDGQPATLIGHSTGGMVALGVALQAPERVARLILISPVIWNELTGSTRLWMRLSRYPRLARLAVSLPTQISRISWRVFYLGLQLYLAESGGFRENLRAIEIIRDGHREYRKTSIAGMVGTSRVLQQTDLRPALLKQGLRVPTLLLHGTRDGAVPLAQSRWLAEHCPQVTLVELPGAGHICYAEREAEVNQHILAWLAEHPIA